MPRLWRVLGALHFVIQLVGATALLGLMIVIAFTVVFRWFGGTFQGSYEVAETFTIVTITSAILMATVKRTHVDVRLIHDALPAAARRYSMALLGLLSVVFWCLVTYAVYSRALKLTKTGEITDVLRINIVPFRWVIVAGFAAVTAVLLYQTIQWFLGRGETDAQGADHGYAAGGADDA